MTAVSIYQQGASDLETVIATAELNRRIARRPNSQRETQAILKLQRQLAEDPKMFFTRLVEAALELSGADSTGISLLNEEAKAFVWPAVAGALCTFVGDGTPRDFGPCGTVMDRNGSMLMVRPERHFAYLRALASPLEEVLLIPFHRDGRMVGTLWAVMHSSARKFDAEDRRLLETLSKFAEVAYRTLVEMGALAPLLQTKAQRKS